MTRLLLTLTTELTHLLITARRLTHLLITVELTRIVFTGLFFFNADFVVAHHDFQYEWALAWSKNFARFSLN